MRSLRYLPLIGAAHAAVVRRDITYSQSTRDPTYAKSFGATGQNSTVNPGVQIWLSGGGTHNWYGNVNNFGSVIISQTDYLKQNPNAGGQTCDWSGSNSANGNLINNAGALISLNDYGSASAPTYDWYLHTMENYGSMQWCGRGDTGGSTFQLYCDIDCHNYGTIDFEQYNSNRGAAFVWRNAAIANTARYNIYNEGAFRLVNVVYHNVQNVYGQGCWVIDEGAVLYLEDGSGAFQNPGYGPTFPNQKIYFTDAAQPANRLQTIHMDTAVYSRNSNFGPQVFNFGSGKAIEFYEQINTFSYANGILTVVMTSRNQVNINLGPGYDASQFYNARNPTWYNTAGYNAIFYRQAPPSQTVPSVCSVSLARCADPGVTAVASSSTTTTTSSTVPPTTTAVVTTTAVTTAATTPVSYVTVTSVYRAGTVSPEPSSSTISEASGGNPGTVAVFYNPNTVTITSLDNGDTTRTTTLAEQTGPTPGTVEILVPGYTTVTTVYRGTGTISPEPSSSTVAQPTGTTSGTVQVYYNPNTVTITSLDSGNTTRTTTLAEQTGPTPGTVEILVPGYTTITTVYRGTGTISPEPSTSTIAQPTGTTSGTVEYFYNPNTITITSLDSGNTTRTSTLVEQNGATAGTVEILVPGYTTITTVYRGTGTISPEPSTSTVVQPTGTTSGTVDVFYNPSTITITSTATDSSTNSRTTTVAEQSGSTPGTVVVFAPMTTSMMYQTITTVYRGSGTISPNPSTTTVVGSDGSTTVEYFYNPNTITITSLDSGNTTRTSTLVEQNGATAGTVEILVPGYSTVTTVYRGTGTISPEPSTSTVVQASGTSSGLVDVFYNPNTITVTSLDNGNTTRTSTIEQQGPTPGTIEIFVPGYTTVTKVYRGSGTISPEPSTSTVAQPTGNTPGEVDVFYNPNTATVTSFDNGNTTRTSTVEQTGPTPGSIIIVEPSYVTRTSIYSGTGTISPEPSTSTVAQPNNGTQGTLDIYYNPNTATITSFDNGDTTRTVTSASQTGSQAGTVVILEPSYVRRTSIYRGSGSISPEPSTSTVAPANSASQGTLDIYYNPNTVTITSLDNGNTTRTSTVASQTGSQAGTVAVLEPSYVTITSTGAADGTTTLSQPTGTTQGTVVVVVATTTTTMMTTSVAVTTTTTTPSLTTTSASTATGPCANGAGPDSTLTLDNGDVYGVCLNTDFSGGDTGTQTGISSPQDLAQACSKTPNCVAGSADKSSKVGTFKNARNPGKANPGVDSVYRISSGNRATTTTSNCVCPSVTTVTYRSVAAVTVTATATRTA